MGGEGGGGGGQVCCRGAGTRRLPWQRGRADSASTAAASAARAAASASGWVAACVAARSRPCSGAFGRGACLARRALAHSAVGRSYDAAQDAPGARQIAAGHQGCECRRRDGPLGRVVQALEHWVRVNQDASGRRWRPGARWGLLAARRLGSVLGRRRRQEVIARADSCGTAPAPRGLLAVPAWPPRRARGRQHRRMAW